MCCSPIKLALRGSYLQKRIGVPRGPKTVVPGMAPAMALGLACPTSSEHCVPNLCTCCVLYVLVGCLVFAYCWLCDCLLCTYYVLVVCVLLVCCDCLLQTMWLLVAYVLLACCLRLHCSSFICCLHVSLPSDRCLRGCVVFVRCFRCVCVLLVRCVLLACC